MKYEEKRGSKMIPKFLAWEIVGQKNDQDRVIISCHEEGCVSRGFILGWRDLGFSFMYISEHVR